MMKDEINILLIEDDQIDAKIIQCYLNESTNIKFNVTHRVDLSEAVSALSQMEFDAVILDLSLPDSSGLKTYKEIKCKNPNLPIVISSGSQLHRDEFREILDDNQHYLVKGYIDSSGLIDTLVETIELSCTHSK